MAATLGTLLCALAALYASSAWLLLRRWAERAPAAQDWRPPVTVLKPLCGAEPHLEACLRSFLGQTYPGVQIVFGVRDPADPAIAVVQRLRAQFPHRDIELVVDERVHGGNPKTSNLINMLPYARHPVLLLSDSDVIVGPGFLGAIVQALAPKEVGAVTCLFRGRAGNGPGSRIAALFVNDWYFPSVLVARALGNRSYASGATIALRRETLERIGGLQPIADHLADDWALCNRVRQAGWRVVVSPCVADTVVHDEALRLHAWRELRWMRTIRTITPAGYAFMGLSMPLPVALLGAWWGGLSGLALSLAALTVLLRVAIHVEQKRRLGDGLGYDLAMIPLRDCLLLAVWIGGFFGNGVGWRGKRYQLGAGGALRVVDGSPQRAVGAAQAAGRRAPAEQASFGEPCAK